MMHRVYGYFGGQGTLNNNERLRAGITLSGDEVWVEGAVHHDPREVSICCSTVVTRRLEICSFQFEGALHPSA